MLRHKLSDDDSLLLIRPRYYQQWNFMLQKYLKNYITFHEIPMLYQMVPVKQFSNEYGSEKCRSHISIMCGCCCVE